MGETCPFWKQVTERTFIHKEAKSIPDFKAFTDKKPLWSGAVGAPGHCSSIKHICRLTLPVSCRSRKSWVTQLLFQYALLCQQNREYCLENNTPKILFIIDNAPRCPLLLMIFAPISTTSSTQSIAPGVKVALEAYYLRRASARLWLQLTTFWRENRCWSTSNMHCGSHLIFICLLIPRFSITFKSWQLVPISFTCCK